LRDYSNKWDSNLKLVASKYLDSFKGDIERAFYQLDLQHQGFISKEELSGYIDRKMRFKQNGNMKITNELRKVYNVIAQNGSIIFKNFKTL